MVEKILNNTTPYGKIRASHEGSLHSSILKGFAHLSSRLQDEFVVDGCRLQYKTL